MNKTRVESLSDGVFSIVMTLLVLDVKVPCLKSPLNSQELFSQMLQIVPLIRSYIISFIILAMYWVAHHAYFHTFTKQVNSVIAYLNILFLMTIAFIPFSSHLIGQYPLNKVAVVSYGINIICAGVTLYAMLWFITVNRHLMHDDVSPKLVRQSFIRVLLPPLFALFGIITGLLHSSSLSFFLFAFPILINIIPGSLTAIEMLSYLIVKHSHHQ